MKELTITNIPGRKHKALCLEDTDKGLINVLAYFRGDEEIKIFLEHLNEIQRRIREGLQRHGLQEAGR